MQTDRIRLTNPDAARALRDTPVLHKFLREANPSDVAKACGMPANLVHHHVKRGLELGLMIETRRETGRVYYQLAAREFTYSRTLLGLEEKVTTLLESLSISFLEAYRVSEAETSNADDPDYERVGFSSGDISPAPTNADSKPNEPTAGHPSHFESRTLRLTPKSYWTLMRELSKIVAMLEAENDANSEPITVTVLGFKGELRPGHDNSHTITSFVQR
jgi:DNA-binding transcriptional ArsR family regulator